MRDQPFTRDHDPSRYEPWPAGQRYP